VTDFLTEINHRNGLWTVQWGLVQTHRELTATEIKLKFQNI